MQTPNSVKCESGVTVAALVLETSLERDGSSILPSRTKFALVMEW
jgi:hypothetical protein